MIPTLNLSLSLVITSYTIGRLNDIFELLDSIKEQTIKDIEIIFIAERSLELYNKVKTYAIDKGIKNFVPVFNDGVPGQSVARNLGIKLASGDVIAFVDDDVLLFPDWVSETLKTYDNETVIGVTGPAYPLWENETITWLPEELYWITSCTDFQKIVEPTSVRTAGGMNMSFRRQAFNYCRFSQEFGHVGQEHKKVGPVVDDAEFSINLRLKTGKIILFNPLVRVKHRVYTYRLSKEFVRGQAYWQGYSKALLRKTYPEDRDTRGLMKERTLLYRILFKLLPGIAMELLSHPKLAWKQLSITEQVLFYVTLGFITGAYPRLTGFSRKRFMA